MSSYFVNESIWEKKELWENIFSIILEKKNNFFEKKRQIESSFNFNKILKDFLKPTKNINESQQQISEKDMKIMALNELNFLMININLKAELAIDYLIDIAQTYFLHLKILNFV